MYRLVVLTSHPIQYQTPFFRAIAASGDINLTVFFRSDRGVATPMYDPEFRQNIQWDIPLQEGYHYVFTKNLHAVIQELKKQKPDALIIYGWNFFFNLVTFLMAKVMGIPVIFYGENPLNHELQKNFLKIFFKKFFLRHLFKYTNTFLYIGSENKKFYAFYGVPEAKLFFAPYAVDNERFIKTAQDLRFKIKDLRGNLGIKENNIVILFVGKLIEKKRPMDLLKAYQQLITNNQQLKNKIALVLVGEGALKNQLVDFVKNNNLENIYFVGFKNQTEIGEYYALADIFVLPSGIGETWGLVANEAMCFRLPLIVSDAVGCGPDLVKDAKNGFKFPLGDTETLARLLSILVSDIEKRRQFGEKSLEIINAYNYEEDVMGIRRALEFIKMH